MKNKPTPFIASYLIIEEQLKKIAHTLKEIEDNSVNRTIDAYDIIKTAIGVIDEQHARTRSIVLSALIDFEPGVVYAFADNQLDYQMLGLKLLELGVTLSQSSTPLEKATTVATLIHHFNKYSIAIHENMSREEATLLPLLYRYYDDKDITMMQMRAEQRLSIKHLYQPHLEPSY